MKINKKNIIIVTLITMHMENKAVLNFVCFALIFREKRI